MLYHLYELNHAAVKPLREAAFWGSKLWSSPSFAPAYTTPGKFAAASFEFFLDLTCRYAKPEFGLTETMINGFPVEITEERVWKRSFCNLLHFQRNPESMQKARGKDWYDPRVLVVAPLSGHYSTLLRGTVEAMLPEHDVYITDWADARNVPLTEGRFDLNDYVEYIMEILQFLGPNTHVIGICQPGPPVLAAISIMSEDDDPCLPSTMTFMGSPIDTRRSPTLPNKLAEEKPFSWFEQNMIYSVPWPNQGAFRRVYPGFVQLGGFISMNHDTHMDAHKKYFSQLVSGDCDSVQKHREFYNEYLAVLDLTEEFYLQTIQDIFQQHKLPKGEFYHHGRQVKPEAITKVALMTVEGEKDDISGIGQTQAAHDLCYNIPKSMRFDYIQPGVGHYGVFNGRRFRTEIQPRMRDFIRSHYDWEIEKDYINSNQSSDIKQVKQNRDKT